MKKRTFLFALLCMVLALPAGLAWAENKTEKGPVQMEVPLEVTAVEYISDIVFSQPPVFGYANFPLKMDVIKPSGQTELPAVVFVTGGGLMAANKDNYLQQRIEIAKAGYVVASIEYRVTPQSTFPAPLEDVKSAVRYLRANAKKWGINSKRIAVMGNSAGGYLAALAGTTNGIREFDKGGDLNYSSRVQAVVDLYGLSDLTRIGEGFSEETQKIHESASAPEAMLIHGPAVFGKGGTIRDNPEGFEKANPITYITKDDPPFLIMHGDKDTLVSPNQSKILHEALTAGGVQSIYYIVKDAGHGGPHWAQPKVVQTIIDFLDLHLKDKETDTAL